MDENQSRRNLWNSIRSIMAVRWGRENLSQLGRDAVGSPGNATRIKNLGTNVGIDMLDRIAAWADLEAWQLLVPGFSADRPPRLGRERADGSGEGPIRELTRDELLEAMPPEWRDVIRAYETLQLFPEKRDSLMRPILDKAEEIQRIAQALDQRSGTVIAIGDRRKEDRPVTLERRLERRTRPVEQEMGHSLGSTGLLRPTDSPRIETQPKKRGNKHDDRSDN